MAQLREIAARLEAHKASYDSLTTIRPYTLPNPLQSSRDAWLALARPLHVAVASYLDHDAVCPSDGPFSLTIGQLVGYTQHATETYKRITVELFDALRTASKSAAAKDDDDWIPVTSRRRRHKHDAADCDSNRGGGSPHNRGGNSSSRRTQPRRIARPARGTHRAHQSGSSSSASSTTPRIRSATELPRSVPADLRRATHRLEDGSSRILGLSDDDASDQPLSSTSARNLVAAAADHEQAAACAATAAAQAESARIAAIQREYIQVDVKKRCRMNTMPAADNEDSGEFTSTLSTSIRRTVRNILQLADSTGVQRFEDSDWVDGWQNPLHKALHRATSRRSPDIATSLTQAIDGFLSAMDTDPSGGLPGPDLLHSLEKRLTGYCDHSTRASSIQRQSSFGVATDVPFADYLRHFELIVSSAIGVGR